MTERELNPTGNLWDRLVAAYYLVRWPHEFLRGVQDQTLAKLAELSHRLTCGEINDLHDAGLAPANAEVTNNG